MTFRALPIGILALFFSATNFATALASVQMAAKRNGFVDGNFFLELCNAEEKSLPIASGYCSGYIAAVADLDNGTCSPNDNSNFQLPSNSTQSQLKKVVLNWLNQHPEKLHFGAAGLVEIALSENFPCK